MNWTTRADVVAKLRRRWDSGEFLTAFADGRPWEPIGVPLRGPKPREIGANFAAVQDWVRAWRAENGGRLRVESGPVGGRLIGTNELPTRVWVDDYPRLWTLLGVTREVKRFAGLVDRTRADAPRLVDWMVRRPHTVLRHTDDTWHKIVDTIRWIDDLADRSVYIRQIDVPGVDTKFIESNRSMIAPLLDRQLDPSRIDPAATTFAGRYGLREKPRYVRYRWVDPDRNTAGCTELTVRVAELAPLDVTSVFVLENETTYLAFPNTAGAIAIFGGGYAVTRLNGLTWLRDQPLIYWGDLDTHGFTILDTLRHQFPEVRSMLMDRTTLLDHESQWVREDKPTTGHLPSLTEAEAALYADLVADTFGPAVRLEQERVRYSAIMAALDEVRSCP
ncbi:MAG TPA: Wadjet anti-phage system protein JetD domain-containing protein [Pseudonocardiaceae bacterium]